MTLRQSGCRGGNYYEAIKLNFTPGKPKTYLCPMLQQQNNYANEKQHHHVNIVSCTH